MKTGIPFVQFDRVISNIGCSVINDNFQGAYSAVKHLIEKGYQKVAHLHGPLTLKIYQDRKIGFQKALSECEKEASSKWICYAKNADDAQAKAAAMLSGSNPPDAFFCSGDNLAVGALKAARNLSLSIPDHVGIVGFSNEPFTEFVTPKISSVDQYSAELGFQSAQMLLELIERESIKSNLPVIKKKLVPELIVRESSSKTP